MLAMMTPQAMPTILLIPSSFCPSALLWDKTINHLHRAGYATLAIELPSVGPPSTAPGKTMLDDAAHIHGIVQQLADGGGKEVVLVMHSYGGVLGTQAVDGLSVKERSERGAKGGVIGLVYVNAILINAGENLMESLAPFSGGGPPEFFRFEGEYITLSPEGAAAAILPELAKEQGEAWIRKFPGQAAAPFQEKLTSTSHYDVPITYVKCSKDMVVSPAHQQKMIDDVRGVSSSVITVAGMECGHCPMVVEPDKMAEIIVEAVGKMQVD